MDSSECINVMYTIIHSISRKMVHDFFLYILTNNIDTLEHKYTMFIVFNFEILATQDW